MNHHPSDHLLAEYAAGITSDHLALCISMHLLFCPECKAKLGRMNTLGGELISQLPDSPVSETLLDSVLDQLDEDQNPATPTVNSPMDLLKTWIPSGLTNVSWKKQWIKISEHVLQIPKQGKWRLSLQKISAGGTAPYHGHHGREVTVVLQGGFSDEAGVYHQGDFILREKGESHQPRAFQNEDCICLAYLEAPVELAGPIGKWLERLKGFFVESSDYPLPDQRRPRH